MGKPVSEDEAKKKIDPMNIKDNLETKPREFWIQRFCDERGNCHDDVQLTPFPGEGDGGYTHVIDKSVADNLANTLQMLIESAHDYAMVDQNFALAMSVEKAAKELKKYRGKDE